MHLPLREAIERQKKEHTQQLSRSYTQRDQLARKDSLLASDLIKVITGPRRAGKSVFGGLLLADVPHAYFNFEDETVASLSSFDTGVFMRELLAVYGDVRHIFFDEIQNVPHWETFLNRLHREGYNLVVTGSNARLLSRELATSLTGRHTPIELLPYSYSEILRARNIDVTTSEATTRQVGADRYRALEDYVERGGYPEVVEKGLEVNGYLDVLFDALLYADVVKRYRLRQTHALEALGVYLINNAGSRYTLRRLTDTLGFKSDMTLETYLSHLRDAYLVYSLQQYSYKVGARLRAPKKVYVVDNGYIAAKAVRHAPDMGARVENMVFVELVKSGLVPNKSLFTYTTRNNREVDFVRLQDTKVHELIQVAYDVSRRETRAREEAALVEAAKEVRAEACTIVTWDHDAECDHQGTMIRYISLPRWLLTLQADK